MFTDGSKYIINHPSTSNNLLHTKSHDKNIEMTSHIGIWEFRVGYSGAALIQSLASAAFIRLEASGSI